MPKTNLSHIPELFTTISDNMEKVVKGKTDVIWQVLLCFFAEGHLLIEDSPGLGKTLIAKALTHSIDADFSRIQFTSDLLPSDLVGVSIWNPAKNEFKFHQGPIFSNLVLADEINRSSPKTQSALLEALAESQTTIDGNTYLLPKPFMVIATQNLVEINGTYPLLKSQLDRFMMVVNVGYPDENSEAEMLDSHQVNDQLSTLKSVVDKETLNIAIKSVAETFVDDSIRKYIVDIATQTRNHPDLEIGMSPRATLNLQRISQSHAVANNRDYVTPEDVQSTIKPTIAHRIRPLSISIKNTHDILNEIIEMVPIPKISKTSNKR